MSGYHYTENSGCNGCLSNGSYSDLADTTNYTCDQPCLCRFSDERSVKDRIMYDWFVLNKPMNLPLNGIISQPSSNCGSNSQRR